MNGELLNVPGSSSCKYVETRMSHNKIWDLLVYKHFQQCLEECARILENCMCLSTNERVTSEECEWLCLISIQAYAELNRWSEALPLVTQLYNGIEDCPGKVFQSCLLLHAAVNDYPTCTAICNIWLKNPNNFSKPQYKLIVELYIAKVLVVLDRWSDIGAFLEKCPGLSPEVKEGYKRHIKTLQRKKEQADIDKIEKIRNTGSDNGELVERDVLTGRNHQQTASHTTASPHRNDSSVSPSKFRQVMAKLTELRTQLMSSPASQFLQRLALIVFILYILLTRLNLDMLPWESITSVYQTISHLWKAMFAPFHIARTA